MSTSNGDNAFRCELEHIVKTELALAESSPLEELEEEVAGIPFAEPVPDTDGLRYEIRLRTLLGAIEALEDDSRGD